MNEEDIVAIIRGVNWTLNLASIVCGLITVTIIVTLGLIDKSLMDRLSLRFTLAISLTDVIRAIAILIYSHFQVDDWRCSLLSFSLYWLTLLYLFLTVAIAVNLQLVFINGRTFNPKWETRYWTVAIVLSLLLPAIPLGFGKLGFDEITLTCDYRDGEDPSARIWIWVCHLSWVVLACIYCTVVVIITIIRLKTKETTLNRILESNLESNSNTNLDTNNLDTNNLDTNSNLDTNNLNTNLDTNYEAIQSKYAINRLILRVSLYCLIPIFTQLTFVISRDLEFTNPNDILLFIAMIMTDIPGVLNLIAFLLDPAFHNALSALRHQPIVIRLPFGTLLNSDRLSPLTPLEKYFPPPCLPLHPIPSATAPNPNSPFPSPTNTPRSSYLHPFHRHL